MTRRRPPDADVTALLERALRALKPDAPANDEAPEVDEAAIDELARHDAEQMIRARKR